MHSEIASAADFASPAQADSSLRKRREARRIRMFPLFVIQD
jgi:hypothetical protein